MLDWLAAPCGWQRCVGAGYYDACGSDINFNSTNGKTACVPIECVKIIMWF